MLCSHNGFNLITYAQKYISVKANTFINSDQKNATLLYRDKICVYDEHPIAGQDIQCRAPNSRSRYITPFDDY